MGAWAIGIGLAEAGLLDEIRRTIGERAIRNLASQVEPAMVISILVMVIEDSSVGITEKIAVAEPGTKVGSVLPLPVDAAVCAGLIRIETDQR